MKGDPVDGALLVMAAKGGYWREYIEKKETRLEEYPFVTELRHMSVIYRNTKGNITIYTKGAPETVLGLCTYHYVNGKKLTLSELDRKKATESWEQMAEEGMQVLAFACKETADIGNLGKEPDKNYTFIGLCGMIDSLSSDVIHKIHSCRMMGIQVLMLTGDHPAAARVLAADIGLVSRGGKMITGEQLDVMTDEELYRQSEELTVCAGVTPVQKLRIVKALKKAGKTIAFAGGGLEELPILDESKFGIAHDNAADVFREESNIILAKNRFSAIAEIIEQGQIIYQNIIKIIHCILACSSSIMFLTLLVALNGSPSPFSASQLLWCGLVGSWVPVILLSGNGVAKPRLSNPIQKKGGGLLSCSLWLKSLMGGIIIALAAFIIFRGIYLLSGNINMSKTAVFNTLVLSQILYTVPLVIKQQGEGQLDFIKKLNAAAVVLILMTTHIFLVSAPLLQFVFHTVPANPFLWLVFAMAAVIPAGFQYLNCGNQ